MKTKVVASQKLSYEGISLAKIEQIMQDNPDLSCEFVHQLLLAQKEVDSSKVEPFEFE